MSRVNKPLRLMGARLPQRIAGRRYPSLWFISGGNLKGITYHMPVARAGKSAILLAGLSALGKTR